MEKAEILELVRKSPVSVKETLAELGVPRSTYYAWRRRKEESGVAGLRAKRPAPRRVWNRLRDREVETVLGYAHRYTDRSRRELACMITDEAGFSVSESTVYRILKAHGLIAPALAEVAVAEKEYHRKTSRVHELWQTDLTYVFVVGWGWYYVGGVLDDYSRYLIAYRVVKDMMGPTLTDIVQDAVEATGLLGVPVEQKATLLSDNGADYVSRPFNEYLEGVGIRHIYASRYHSQTLGKFERLNRMAKSHLRLVVQISPGELAAAVAEFAHWYNHERYHEAIGNVRPVDMYESRAEQLIARRKEVQVETVHERRKWNLLLNCQVE